MGFFFSYSEYGFKAMQRFVVLIYFFHLSKNILFLLDGNSSFHFIMSSFFLTSTYSFCISCCNILFKNLAFYSYKYSSLKSLASHLILLSFKFVKKKKKIKGFVLDLEFFFNSVVFLSKLPNKE